MAADGEATAARKEWYTRGIRSAPMDNGSAISTKTAALWAKTQRSKNGGLSREQAYVDGSNSESEHPQLARQWHSLAAHLVDAAHVAHQLWNHWLTPATRRWLAEPVGDEGLGAAFFAWLAGCHDLGKASPAFQIQVRWLADQLRKAGLPLPFGLPMRGKAPHSKVSAVAIGPLLAGRFGWGPDAIAAPTAILGGHHGWFPQAGLMQAPRERPELYGWSRDPAAPWMAARSELFDLVVTVAGAKEALAVAGGVEFGRARELTFAGFVVLADWLASNEQLFPYTSAPFTADYVDVSAHRAAEALAAIGWRRWETSGHVLEFERRFGFPPNALQREVIGVAQEATGGGLVLIEAPTGIGKTEAALAAVELLAVSQGLGGTFVALPTQATSNQAFTRARRWLEHLGPGVHVMELAHGKARQLTEYQEIHGLPSCVDIDEEPGGSVTAEAWFGGSKRRLLAPFVVGTVDQALLCAARVKHVALRQVGLHGKVVVVDEVHAYDAHMSVFLRRALRWLGEAQIPVVLLSATLPPPVRQRLVEAYTGAAVALGIIGYPSVTHVTVSGTVSSKTVGLEEPARDAAIRLIEERGSRAGQEVTAAVGDMVRRGANVLLIRNTVTRAQETGRQLYEMLDPDQVTVLHARFLASDRLAKEQELSRRFGRGGQRPSGHVVVGTQVLEQSLDVDFDVLVSDVAPMDLLLQRIGRVHRHPEVARPAGFEHPMVVLCGLTVAADGPEFPAGSTAVYAEHLLLRTTALLVPPRSLRLPDDVPRLVADVYGDTDLAPVAWQQRAQAPATKWHQAQQAAEKRAQQYAIPPPDGAPNLLELCRIGLGDPDDDDPLVQAAVRGAPVAPEVVVGWATDSDDEVICGDRCVSLDQPPSPEAVDAALSSTLRVPPWLAGQVLALEVPAGWRQHPWLRHHRLLRLDQTNTTILANKTVRYSSELGLEVTADAQ